MNKNDSYVYDKNLIKSRYFKIKFFCYVTKGGGV